MSKDERRSVSFEGSEHDSFGATWSRSGKRLIVTVAKRGSWAQVELEPAQVEELAQFLTETTAKAPADR